MNFEDSIAHTAHGYVHGERAKSYGHPRFDFRIIAKVWSGLLQDKLKPGEELDEYRVAVLMTGLKLARLVKSPDHIDSRIDTIGYMLTMERLDEPAEGYDVDSEFTVGKDGQYEYSEDSGHDWETENKNCDCLAGACTCKKITIDRANQLVFSQLKLWFEPGETKYVNGQGIVNDDKDCGKIIFIPIAPGTNDLTISPHPPKEEVKYEIPPPEWDDLNKKWICGHKENDHGLPHVGECLRRQQAERLINAVTHNHEQQAPCMPPCPVWLNERQATQFPFTGEHVEMKPHGNE